MNNYEKVLKAIENFITQREAESKKYKINYKNSITVQWTLTQLHIVAIIKKNRTANNTFLSEELNISKPAVSKAIKKLLTQNMIVNFEVENNKKEMYYALTEQGENLANIHEKLHEEARQKYIKIFKEFTDDDLVIVQNFLETLTLRLQSGCDNDEKL